MKSKRLNKTLYEIGTWSLEQEIDRYLVKLTLNKCMTEYGDWWVSTENNIKNNYDMLVCYLWLKALNLRFKRFKELMMSEFDMINLGMLSYFLEIEILNSLKWLILHPRKYASEVIKRFKMGRCVDATTPIKVNPS